MATGELKTVRTRQGRWGKTCLLEVRDDALSMDGVNCGDYLVVDRGAIPPIGDGFVVVLDPDGKKERVQFARDESQRRKTKIKTERGKLLLRKLEHFGAKVRLQPGSSPRRPPFLAPETAGIWGTVVAVMRKFAAA